jgi:hypothetical protein
VTRRLGERSVDLDQPAAFCYSLHGSSKLEQEGNVECIVEVADGQSIGECFVVFFGVCGWAMAVLHR